MERVVSYVARKICDFERRERNFFLQFCREKKKKLICITQNTVKFKKNSLTFPS